MDPELKAGAPDAPCAGAPVDFCANVALRTRGGGAPRWAALVIFCALTGSPALAVGELGPRRQGVRSLQELREANVVRQHWDLSCGAAALSTILTYHLGDPVTEAEIIESILRRSDPVRIRARHGFSLLDLKRFANSRGHPADGYGQLDVPHLERLGPAIVPTRIGGYNHFVVFRGRVGDRVVLADPAFGNRTMTIERFEALWPMRIAFVVGDGRRRHSPLATVDPAMVPIVPGWVVRRAIGTWR
jgi:predicted double-glycine peptidase